MKSEMENRRLYPKGIYIPIRGIITSGCNYKCYFCHREGLRGGREDA